MPPKPAKPPALGAPVQAPVASRDPDLGDHLTNLLADTPPAQPADTPPAKPADTPPAQPADTPPAKPADAPPAQPADTPPAKPADADVGPPADVLLPPDTPKPADPHPADADEPPEGSPDDAKVRHAWAEKTRRISELRDQLAAREADIERMRTSQTPELEEVNRLRAQLEDNEKRIGQYDLASTREFQSRFTAPMVALQQRAVSLLVRSGKDAEKARMLVSDLMKQAASGDVNLEQVQAQLADETFAVQGALVNAVNEYAELAAVRNGALDKWKESRAALKVQSERDQGAMLAQNIERDTAVALAAVVKEGNWMFVPSNTDPKWTATVDERVKAVKGILRTAKGEELVKWVAEGVTARDARQLFLAERARSQALKAQLDELVAATPRLGAGGAPGGARPVPAQPRDVNTVLNEEFRDMPRTLFRS